jgi:hypothetical protein
MITLMTFTFASLLRSVQHHIHLQFTPKHALTQIRMTCSCLPFLSLSTYSCQLPATVTSHMQLEEEKKRSQKGGGGD